MDSNCESNSGIIIKFIISFQVCSAFQIFVDLMLEYSPSHASSPWSISKVPFIFLASAFVVFSLLTILLDSFFSHSIIFKIVSRIRHQLMLWFACRRDENRPPRPYDNADVNREYRQLSQLVHERRVGSLDSHTIQDVSLTHFLPSYQPSPVNDVGSGGELSSSCDDSERHSTSESSVTPPTSDNNIAIFEQEAIFSPIKLLGLYKRYGCHCSGCCSVLCQSNKAVNHIWCAIPNGTCFG